LGSDEERSRTFADLSRNRRVRALYLGQSKERGIAVIEFECICCGAELSDHPSYPRPVMSSMCGSCIREVEFMQRAAGIIDQQDQPPSGDSLRPVE
jgi:hypothetical protein